MSDAINTTLIKLEDDTEEFSIQHFKSSSPMAYKGQIEVTSKGRRKIFDGVRWQILCRRTGLFNSFVIIFISFSSRKIVENKRIKNLFALHIIKKNMEIIIIP